MAVPRYLKHIRQEIRIQLQSDDSTLIVSGLVKMNCCSGLLPPSRRDLDLVVAVADHEDLQVRSLCIELLGRFGKRRRFCVRTLVRALRDPEAGLRDEACQALAGTTDPDARAALARSLKDPDEDVRFSAIMSLGEAANGISIPQLRRALLDKSRLVRLAVVQVLGDRASRRAERATIEKILAQRMGQERDPLVRVEALGVLHQLGRPGCLPEIIKLSRSPNPSARYRACDVLGLVANHDNAVAVIAALREARGKEYPAHRPRLAAIERSIRAKLRFCRSSTPPLR